MLSNRRRDEADARAAAQVDKAAAADERATAQQEKAKAADERAANQQAKAEQAGERATDQQVKADTAEQKVGELRAAAQDAQELLREWRDWAGYVCSEPRTGGDGDQDRDRPAEPVVNTGGDSGSTGGDDEVTEVVGELNALFPAPNVRDNTGFCEGERGCEQLVTTDAVSVWEFPNVATADHWMANGYTPEQEPTQAGRFVLTYGLDRQQLTSDEARAAYLAKVNELAAD